METTNSTRPAQSHLESLIRELEAQSFSAQRQITEAGPAEVIKYATFGPSGPETWDIPVQAFRNQVDRAALCVPVLQAELDRLNHYDRAQEEADEERRLQYAGAIAFHQAGGLNAQPI